MHYRIDPTASTATFTTRHLFGLGAVTGTLAVGSGSAEIAGDRTGSVTADLDAATFSTGNLRRDADVRGPKYLAVDDHPTIRFAGTIAAPDTGTVRGTLTVQGRDAPVELGVVGVAETTGGLLVTAEGDVDRYALGITAGRGLAARTLHVRVAVALVG